MSSIMKSSRSSCISERMLEKQARQKVGSLNLDESDEGELTSSRSRSSNSMISNDKRRKLTVGSLVFNESQANTNRELDLLATTRIIKLNRRSFVHSFLNCYNQNNESDNDNDNENENENDSDSDSVSVKVEGSKIKEDKEKEEEKEIQVAAIMGTASHNFENQESQPLDNSHTSNNNNNNQPHTHSQQHHHHHHHQQQQQQERQNQHQLYQYHNQPQLSTLIMSSIKWLLQQHRKHNKEMSTRRRRGIVAADLTTSVKLISCFISLILLVEPALSAAKNADQERQLQLLRSANVELSRRSQRIQRDTSPPLSLGDIQVTMPVQQQSFAMPTCGYPGSPAHASVTFNSSQVVAGTAASYTCDNGYELLGPPRRICQANGTWSPVGIPFCVLNVGLGKAAMQSSTAGHGSAQKAVDGSTSPYFQSSTCTMTDVENNPWWYVNLLEPYLVQIVRIDFGTACCANRQKATIAVRVGNNRPDLGNNPLCNRYHGFIEEGKPLFLPCTRPAPGAFVSIHLEAPSGSALSICETFIYTDHALSIEQCPSFRDQPLGSTATYNGKCYIFHNNQALNFDGARKYCESRGGTLVDETSPALQGFLSWELYRRHRNDQQMGQYWLGAVKNQRDPQNWKWINGKDVQISFWSSAPGPGSNCSRFDGSKGWLWSDTECGKNLNFICQYRPLSCGKPEKPTNSTLITKNIDNGTVIEYQCAPGNLLMGPRSRACLPTGFFSEFAPKCKYLDCQFPAMIANGDYKLLNGTTSYQSTVSYFCNEGFQIYGKATLTCDVDERWNGPPPRCEPLLCPAPVAPSNGYVTVTSNVTLPGTQATYDCRPSYELVGDRLLTCTQSGSWDFNFPYCKERRVPIMPVATPPPQVVVASTPSKPNSKPIAQPISTSRPLVGSVIFPTNRPAFSASSTALTPTATTSTSTTTTTTASSTSPAHFTQSQAQFPTSSTNLPASLNGLVGQQQFTTVAQQQQTQASMPQVTSSSIDPSLVTTDGLHIQKTAQSSSVSQFAAPPSLPPQQQPPVAAQPQPQPPSQPEMPSLQPQLVVPPNLQIPISVPAIQPQQPALQQQVVTQIASRFRNQQPGNNNGLQQQSTTSAASNQQSQFSSLSPMPTSSSRGQQVSSSSTTSNKFQFDNSMTTNSGSSFDRPGGSHPVGSVLASASTPAATSPTSTSAFSQQPPTSNILASLHPTGGARTHNTLANAKYSLDGIIAVAIFGGFIFLGAIITIIVIIIRRKSSHSSSIDAQTISTYDSNGGGEHNGLYRNYQQAWENLRFANPNSQPKSSGGGGVGLMGAPLASSVGLKNFGTPVHAHAHAHLHHAHLLSSGHHNLGLTSETSESSGSSAGSSHAGSTLGGANGNAHLHNPHRPHHHAHHHHHRHMSHGHLHEQDDDDDDDEQGVLSVDEHHYHGHGGAAGPTNSSEPLSGEGFRDSNELTINADTAPIPQQQTNLGVGGGTAGRRARYSVGSVGHALAASSGQRQRLVATTSSSSPSSSNRSSRASPPSGDEELEQLAYGTGWRNPAGSGNIQPHQSAGSSSSNNHSAGSGASILGGRASMRYS